MHDGHILCPEHLVHGSFLGRIKPRELHGLKGKSACFLMRIEKVSQISQTVILCLHRTVERFKHQFITRFIEGQLHADRFFCLQVEQGNRIRHINHHSVTIHIVDRTGKGEIFK